MKLVKYLLIMFLCTIPVFAQDLTFTFDNGMLTGSAPNYYFEFDVMVHADEESYLLGDNMVYINYSTTGFGSSVVSAGDLTVEKGTLISGGSSPFFYYSILNEADNTSSKFAITVGYLFPANPELLSPVPTTPTQLLHIQMGIVDSSVWSDLNFDNSLMSGQQYFSTNAPGDTFDTVIASDFLDLPLKYFPSAISSNSINTIPTAYKVHQNHPNPFNPTTTLHLDIPAPNKNINVSVYNILGQKIVTLYSGSMQAGSHKLIWSGKNNRGVMAPSGIYFAVMKGPNILQSIKMTLLR